MSVIVPTVEWDPPPRCFWSTTIAMLRFSMASASGWAYRGRKLRTNVLKVSFNWRRASEAMVSKTMDDLPDPDTPVKIVILRFGMHNDTFFRLFSRAPRIVINSWDTIRSFFCLSTPDDLRQHIEHDQYCRFTFFVGGAHFFICRQDIGVHVPYYLSRGLQGQV